jgi:hypothetical protein
MTEYDTRHGGPYDRGGADAYYRRNAKPHYFKEGTYSSQLVEEPSMTAEEIAAYYAGFKDTIDAGDFKNWG